MIPLSGLLSGVPSSLLVKRSVGQGSSVCNHGHLAYLDRLDSRSPTEVAVGVLPTIHRRASSARAYQPGMELRK